MHTDATAARLELDAHLTLAPTPLLVECLTRLGDQPSTEATRRLGAEIIETLTGRVPEVTAALQAWVNDDADTSNMIEVVVRTVEAAA